ncbi:MAG: hypothetical protein HRU19_32520 [Pseudobacteriovorax sp.]|nr:hypothetical protein [Pseudobacteriovorax sp.]
MIEVYDGKFEIHNCREYNIMTNEPDFTTQLKINDYWR